MTPNQATNQSALCKHGGDWEIVLAGKQSEAGGLGQSAERHTWRLTLGAMRVEVNYYNRCLQYIHDFGMLRTFNTSHAVLYGSSTLGVDMYMVEAAFRF